MYVRGHFRTHWFNWKLSKEHLYFVQISTFLEGVSPRILVKNDQILSSAKLTFVFFPRDLGVWYLSLGNHFLVQITPWQRIVLLTLTLSSSFLGYFFVPGPFERPKKCIRGCFRTHWFNWKLLKEHLYFVQKWTFSKGLVHGFWSKMTKFWSRQFSLVYVPRDLGVSYLYLGNHFSVQITPWHRIFSLTLTLSSSFLGYFFVSGPLTGLKSVSEDVLGHTDSIGIF